MEPLKTKIIETIFQIEDKNTLSKINDFVNSRGKLLSTLGKCNLATF